MNAPRIARAGRSKFLVVFGLLVLTAGFVAIFHSSQQQLDEVRHMELRCEQQQESLTAQVHALEKALQEERQGHHHTKGLLKNAKEERELKDQRSVESNMRFESLQQHFNLLKSEKDDLDADCASTKKKNLEEINGLQGKVKSVQSQLAQSERQKVKEVEHWKVTYNQLQSEKDHLQSTLNENSNASPLKYKIYKLEDQIKNYNTHCAWRPDENEQPRNYGYHETKDIVDATKSFNAQVAVSDDIYEIQNKINNQTTAYNVVAFAQSNRMQILPKPLSDELGPNLSFQDNLVLPVPQPLKSSTSSSAAAKKSSQTEETRNKMGIPLASVPTAKGSSSSTARIDHIDSVAKPRAAKPVPVGVVPVPEAMNSMLAKEEDNSNNNRYLNAIDEIAGKKVDNLAAAPANDDNENGAHEVNDNNGFVVEEKMHNDHFQERNMQNNDAAEEEANNFDTIDGAGVVEKQPIEDKLINEFVADQGKVPEYQEGLQIEEQPEEEDDDEYDHPARKQEPAIRN